MQGVLITYTDRPHMRHWYACTDRRQVEAIVREHLHFHPNSREQLRADVVEGWKDNEPVNPQPVDLAAVLG